MASTTRAIVRRSISATLAAGFLLSAVLSQAATLTVTNVADSGTGTLRDRIAAAAAGDTINFSATLNNQAIRLTSGQLIISRNLSILGPGSSLLTLSGTASNRVAWINPG